MMGLQDDFVAKINQTYVEYPRAVCIHELFEQQVELTLEAIAVVCQDETITYGELNHRANQLSYHLQELGVGPEQFVGICVERSIEMVVGLLGILKAGGAYLPLDPDFPKDRLAFMIEDTQASVLVTQQSLVAELPPHSATLVCLDTHQDEIAAAVASTDSRKVMSSNLAYVIYTSGSTGKPKGVQIPHYALTNFLCTMQEQPGLSERDILLAITTLSFDIAELELYLPLITGGRVVIAPKQVTADGRALAAAIEDVGATVMQATPATWRMLLHAGWEGSQNLKVLCGGEALSLDLAEQLLARSGELWNMFGPTETTVWSTVKQISADDEKILVGRPIANTEVYVLDDYLQLVPIGMEGELVIGGDGLAVGYLNRPDLTAERFIPHPFSERPGARLYRTGDLARFQPEGSLEHLGRMDHQVKIRGYRIELGEIETNLNRHPAVHQAVVVAREDTPGNQQLVAYVVPESAQKPTIGDLRRFLNTSLPDYMLPSARVLLDALPLTPNAKVDRRALPAPDLSRPELSEAFVAPRTLLEGQVAAIWAQVLGMEDGATSEAGAIGIHDNFFELGGHSLSATQVISRLLQEFSVELTLPSLFKVPTIAGLAQLIEQAQQAGQDATSLRILPVERTDNVPISCTQESLWLLDQLGLSGHSYNMQQVMRLQGTLNVPALTQALTEIVRRHESLRTTFVTIDGQPVQIIGDDLHFPLPLENLSGLDHNEQEAKIHVLARNEVEQTFDLAQGPLLRGLLLRLADSEHVLILTMHHIISDEWSLWVFWHELTALYEAFVIEQPSPLAELTIQYADYAYFQRQWIQGAFFDEQLTYWKEQLADLPILEMPTDRPRPPKATIHGARYPLTLSSELTQSLQALRLNQKNK
ncbi:amino acid adenylation domain-containing protein [Chloroflexi bacterium TSY]|nr:amino acid adenylation domain-containing protein [Chloroflexi bacterium TSY]